MGFLKHYNYHKIHLFHEHLLPSVAISQLQKNKIKAFRLKCCPKVGSEHARKLAHNQLCVLENEIFGQHPHSSASE